MVQTAILDELDVRLRRRQTISHVQDNYDGAVPLGGIQDVPVQSEDIELMWKVFDYGSVSSDQDGPPPASAIRNIDQSSSQLEQSLSSNLVASQLNNCSTLAPSYQYTNSTSTETFPEQLEDFDFGVAFADDWLLFGKPWSAYFPQDISVTHPPSPTRS